MQNCPLTRVTPQLVPFTLQQWLPEAVLFEALKSLPSLPPQEQWIPPLTLFSPHLSNDRFHPLCPDPREGQQLQGPVRPLTGPYISVSTAATDDELDGAR